MTFTNCPLIDFTSLEELDKFRSALAREYEKLSTTPAVVPLIINGEKVQTAEQIQSIDPSLEQTIATVHCASREHAAQALLSLQAGQRAWQETPATERAECIRAAAGIMEERRYALASLLVLEAGKPWREADADIAEAIDFCRYYASEMERLEPPRRTSDVLGEHSVYFYQPRGITAVIAPWNFPFAIPCGMTVAALVAGNAVILKPAEQTSMVAYRLAEILLEAGIPADAFAFLPGRGENVGDALVNSPDVHMIVFTGSRAVGLQIIQHASIVHPGQRHIKKVVAEMGGKNTIIIDEDADLDEAIHGVLYSTFGFSGQKCSACSRAIAVGSAYEPFIRRLQAATRDLIVGSVHEPGVFFGPVIDRASRDRLRAQQEQAAQEAHCLFKGTVPDTGYFVPAAVFTDVPFDSWIWTDELFGPVLAVGRTDSFEQALEIANESEYALTGGIYSRSPKNIELATRSFAVGNLYINRGCTGAIVSRHPFGGFRLSGVGSKAGGPDYLLQFMEPRTVTENTMRRGFTPDLTT